MLRRLKVRGFKSLVDVKFDFPRFTVLFGPNAAGKSNLLDAIQLLSRIAGTRTLADALAEPIRGYPMEAFSFPKGGLRDLLQHESCAFTIEADAESGKENYRYRLTVELQPRSGTLIVGDEYLTALNAKGEPKGAAAIEVVEGKIRLRRKSHPGKPRYEPLGLGFTMLSDPRLSGGEYRAIERTRSELVGWRTHYLDPRVAMRAAVPPSEVRDIGVLGGEIAPFLYRLRAEHSKHFDAVLRTLRSVVPSVEGLSVDLDERRGTLDILVRQDGVEYSSRIVSEGTLRVLALCAIAVNPWSGSLLAFEEPENGVHPRRLELIGQLLFSLAVERSKQVIITTHSPLLCDAVLKLARDRKQDVALLNVRRRHGATLVSPFDTSGPLFTDQEIAAGLTAPTEDGLFESLMLRGLLDE
jgi:predicted ATPase